MYPSDKSTFMLPRPFGGTEEVYEKYYDTAGNYHYTGTITGHHVIKKDGET